MFTECIRESIHVGKNKTEFDLSRTTLRIPILLLFFRIRRVNYENLFIFIKNQNYPILSLIKIVASWPSATSDEIKVYLFGKGVQRRVAAVARFASLPNISLISVNWSEQRKFLLLVSREEGEEEGGGATYRSHLISARTIWPLFRCSRSDQIIVPLSQLEYFANDSPRYVASFLFLTRWSTEWDISEGGVTYQ